MGVAEAVSPRCATAGLTDSPRVETDVVLDPEGAHLAALLRLAEFRDRHVLEVGCGDGRLTTGIAAVGAARILAFDPDAAAVERACRSLPAELAARVTFKIASATEIDLEPSSFDFVLFSWSLCCMSPEDVAHGLARTIAALEVGGTVLDLQATRPNARVECDGRLVCEVDGGPLFAGADAARRAVDHLIADGVLVEEAVDEHDVLKHYLDGVALVEDWEPKERRLPPSAVPALREIEYPCVVREHCLLRRLRRIV